MGFCDDNYARKITGTQKGPQKGYYSTLIEFDMDLFGYDLYNKILADEQLYVNINDLELYFLNYFTNSLSYFIFGMIVVYSLFYICLDAFICKRCCYKWLIRPQIDYIRLRNEELVEKEGFMEENTRETMFNKFIPTLDINLQPKRVYGWVILFFSLLLGAFTYKSILKVDSLNYDRDQECVSYSLPMEVLSGHATRKWKGIYTLYSQTSDYYKFLKYEYYKIDEILTFLDDPKLLELQYLQEIDTNFMKLFSYTRWEENIDEYKNLVYGLYNVNQKLINDIYFKSYSTGKRKYTALKQKEYNDKVILQVCQMLQEMVSQPLVINYLPDYFTSFISSGCDSQKDFTQFLHGPQGNYFDNFKNIVVKNSIYPFTIILPNLQIKSEYCKDINDAIGYTYDEKLTSLELCGPIDTTIPSPDENEYLLKNYYLNRNLFKICIYWYLYNYDEVFINDFACKQLIGFIDENQVCYHNNTEGFLYPSSILICSFDSTNNVEVSCDKTVKKNFSICDYLQWNASNNNYSVWEPTDTTANPPPNGYFRFSDVINNLTSINQSEYQAGSQLLKFIENVYYETHYYLDFQYYYYDDVSLNRQMDTELCADESTIIGDSSTFMGNNTLYLIKYKDVYVPDRIDCVRCRNWSMIDLNNYGQYQVKAELNSFMFTYKDAIQQNNHYLQEFLSNFKSKIDLIHNFNVGVKEVEGSFEVLNSNSALATVNLTPILDFHFYVDSSLEIMLLLTVGWVIWVLSGLACACERMDDFCCCFCCYCEFDFMTRFFSWLDHKFQTKKSIDYNRIKKNSKHYVYWFDYIWKNLFLCSFILGILYYYYFFIWHIKGDLCEVVSLYYYNNKAGEFFQGHSKDFVDYCVYADVQQKQLSKLWPLEIQLDKLDSLIELVETNRAVPPYSPEYFEELQGEFYKPDLELLYKNNYIQYMNALEDLNTDISDMATQEFFDMLKQLLYYSSKSLVDFVHSGEYEIGEADFTYNMAKSGMEVYNIDTTYDYMKEIKFYLSNYEYDSNFEYNSDTSRVNLYSSLVTINDLTNHSYRYEDIIFDSLQNIYFPTPNARPMNDRMLQYSYCNNILALRDQWMVSEAECFSYCNVINSKYAQTESQSGNPVTCTVNDLTNDGVKDDSASGFNCFSVDQYYDYAQYFSRYRSYFSEYYGCQKVGNPQKATSQVDYHLYISKMLDITIRNHKLGNIYYDPTLDPYISNNLYLVNDISQQALKEVFKTNSMYIYKLNLVKTTMEHKILPELYRIREKLLNNPLASEYDCGWIKESFENYLHDMCGVNKANYMIIYFVDYFILTVIVILALLVRETVRVWRDEDEIRIDEYNWGL